MKNFSSRIKDSFEKIQNHPKTTLLCLGGIYVSYKIVSGIYGVITQQIQYSRMQKVALDKYKSVQQKIILFEGTQQLQNFHVNQGLLVEILNSNIQGLQKMYFDGKTTVREVLLVYIQRAIKYGVPYNWLADVCFEEALDLALVQDQLIAENREVIYQPGNELFGIPVTFKEMFIVKGYDATCGLVSLCNQPYTYDGYQAYAFKKAGAIIFAKTNNPQLGMTITTENFIYGKATNPYNKLYSTGGSSGGEGAMISARCSLLGVGSDIGGSIRIPSSFNGIYGLKPCTKRIELKGQTKIHEALEGFTNLEISNGPLSRDVDDLAIAMKVLLDSKIFNSAPMKCKSSHFKPFEFDQLVYNNRNQKLRIGYFKSINFMPSCSANRRAIDIVLKALSEQYYAEKYMGSVLEPLQERFELIEIDIEQYLVQALQLSAYFAFADNFRIVKQLAKKEMLIPDYKLWTQASLVPKCVLKILIKILRKLGFRRYITIMSGIQKDMYAYDLLLKSFEQKELRDNFAQYWDNLNLNAIICPLTAGVALKHGQAADAYPSLVYSMSWNLLDYTCGIVPITTVQPDECNYNVEDNFSPKDRAHQAYDNAMKDALNLPVSIQVITQPFKEELCLNIMKQIQDLVKFNNPPI